MGTHTRKACVPFLVKIMLCVIGKSKVKKTGRKEYLWEYVCKCGKSFLTRKSAVTSGATRSCGCYKLSVVRTHNMSKTKTYKSWRSMLDRCNNKRHKHFKYYGGKGITVCNRWNSFENFLRDMGERPEGKTLDRIDSNGNYCKENCRWATSIEQGSNRSNLRKYYFKGKLTPIAVIVRETKSDYSVVKSRLRYGYSLENAIWYGQAKASERIGS